MEFLPVARPEPAADAALHGRAAWFDRRARARTIIEGAQAAAMLTGLVTNDVLALIPGTGQYAAAPTPKGKILSDLRILCVGEGRLLVDVPARAAAAWTAMIAKFLPPRLAKHRNATDELACAGVYGPEAAEAAATAAGVDAATLRALAPYAHRPFGEGGAFQVVMRSVDLGTGVEGFDLFAPPDVLAGARAAASAWPDGDDATWHVARVEAGRPEWGLDMDEGTIPQEANFDDLRAISYTKGCYTGQETIARVHVRGHVNRHLRGVSSATAVPPGARLFDGDREVGDVRSSVVSPRRGAIALAMVRREVPVGTTVAWRVAETAGAEAAGDAVITALPAVG
ncbi:MAG: YgfZ/GcvT domain-containing protein [Gemmatimonadota bacterium]